MSKLQYNSKNEIIKAQFFEMLEHAKGRDPKTINSHAKAIHEFEISTCFCDFKKFNVKQAQHYKEHLTNKRNKRTGEPISKSYLRNYTTHVRQFFEWLINQKSYKSIKYDDVQYFNITRNDRNRASSTAYQESYAVDEILSTIRNMPSQDEIELRNKALVSLNFLTTPRISALQSARMDSIKYIKHTSSWAFVQNPNWVNTKYARTITAYFIGNLQDIYDNVLNWHNYLIKKGFTEKDPLFPTIISSFDSDGCHILNLEKELIKSKSTIRIIFKKAFEGNGLDYKKTHSFRHTLVRQAMQSNNSPLLISALNQNMGHALDVGTIISSYGTTPEHERAKVLKSFKLE